MEKGALSNIKYEDPLVIYRGEKVRKITRLLSGRKTDIPLALAIDTFYVFYLPLPLVNEESENEYVKNIVNNLLKIGVTHILRSKTILDAFLSSVASALFLSEYTNLMELENTLRTAGLTKIKSVDQLVDKAVRNVLRDIEDVKKLRSVMEGLEPGTISDFSLEDLAIDVIRLAKDVDVRKIMEIIGKTKKWELRGKLAKQRARKGEISGYELGNDIERIVPSNLLYPQEIFYLKYMQKQLLLYEKVLSERPGPIYVLLDKCLAEGTSIMLSNGVVKPIEKIEIGEELYVLGMSNNGPLIEKARVIDKAMSIDKVYGIVTEKGILKTTSNHILPVINKGEVLFKFAGELKAGDILLSLNEKDFEIQHARVYGVFETGISRTYDIRLDKRHLFFANNIVVHNSGSMDGSKITWAKALAISLYMKAVRSGREFYMRFFDSQPYPLIKVDKRPRAGDVVKLIEYIARVKGSGGTDISRAILVSISDIERDVSSKVSDLVLITDGIDRIAEKTVENGLKRTGTRLLTVMVMGDNKSLRSISYKYFRVIKADENDILRVVESF